MLPHRRKSWHRWAIALGVLFLLGALGGSYSEDGVSFVSKISFSGPSVSAAGSRADSKGQVYFVPNTFTFWDKERNMPTPFGPAYADIVLEKANFLLCRGGPFALCYYSGPEPASASDPDLSCTVDEDGQFANCNCFEIPYGTYFVDIHSILNFSVYKKTVRECGQDGRRCFARINKAPVCDAINQGKFMPGAEFTSTFSLNCAIEEPIGNTDCTMMPFLPYAGCMTASCIRTEVEGIVDCSCPIFTGPYQVGQTLQVSPPMGPQCDLGPDLVWSAAFNPGTGNEGVTFPTDLASETSCTPDIPESFGGCPLLAEGEMPEVPPNVDCQTVCKEYQDCPGAGGVELGLTCDATLCTSTCTDRGLLGEACSGLQKCTISEITKLESEVGCSCCASQVCDCAEDPGFINDATQTALFDLNQAQCDVGITPQCCLNGTLCGENEAGMSFEVLCSSCTSGS